MECPGQAVSLSKGFVRFEGVNLALDYEPLPPPTSALRAFNLLACKPSDELQESLEPSGPTSPRSLKKVSRASARNFPDFFGCPWADFVFPKIFEF